MIRQLKTFTLRLIAGANVVTVVLMLMVGYSGHLNPDTHPMLSNANLFFPRKAVIPALAYLVEYAVYFLLLAPLSRIVVPVLLSVALGISSRLLSRLPLAPVAIGIAQLVERVWVAIIAAPPWVLGPITYQEISEYHASQVGEMSHAVIIAKRLH